jgi:peptidoglycan/LPS O-acetylase OafA/YrhL
MPHVACAWGGEVQSLRRREPTLDGLRGFSILAVLIFHASNGTILPGGFVGVDLFFVLSGYLITALLVREFKQTGTISFRDFYCRRLLRLMPALLILLMVYASLVLLFAKTPYLHFSAIILSITYLMNWARAFDFGSSGYVGHMWSLSIEEQFYLLWPAIAFWSLRLGGRKAAFMTACVLIAASSIWRLWLLQYGADIFRIYNGFDTRADSLLYGCVVALLAENLQKIAFRTWWAVPAFILLYICFTVPFQAGMPIFVFSAVGFCSAWLLVCAISEKETLLVRVLRISPIVYLGRISYGVYLWHYPIALVTLKNLPAHYAVLVTGLSSVAIASISYFAVESYFLNLKRAHFTHVTLGARP